MSDQLHQVEIEAVILKNKIQLWKNTLYDFQIEAEIADLLGDEKMKINAIEGMKKAKKVIDFLEKKSENGNAPTS